MSARRAALALALALAALTACRWRLRETPAPPVDAPPPPMRLPACLRDGPPTRPHTFVGPLRAARTLDRPAAADIGRGACLGDLDGDGAAELVVLRADAFAEVYDPLALCIRTTLAVPPFARACEVADLDGDGLPELALAHSLRFGQRLDERFEGRVLDSVTAGHVEPDAPDGARWRWRWPAAWAFAEDRHVRGVGHVLAATDLDRDGRRELAVAGTVTFDAPQRGAFVRVWEFAPEGCAGERGCPRAVQEHEFFDALDTNDLLVADIDDDPGPELVADLGCNGGGVFAFDGRWSSPPRALASLGQPSHGALADVDGDGDLDYLAATTPRCSGGVGPPTALRWLRPVEGALRHYAAAPHPAFTSAPQAMVAALDVLEDARPEALLCARDGDTAGDQRLRCDLFAFEAPHIDRVWTWTEPDGHPDMLSRILVRDLDGDGLDDALVVTQARIHQLLSGP
jgi:hypothetical protein